MTVYINTTTLYGFDSGVLTGNYQAILFHTIYFRCEIHNLHNHFVVLISNFMVQEILR